MLELYQVVLFQEVLELHNNQFLQFYKFVSYYFPCTFMSSTSLFEVKYPQLLLLLIFFAPLIYFSSNFLLQF